MPIISLKTGTKSRSLLVGNPYFQPTAYESIASLSGNGLATALTFSSIPSTYQHLQLRVIGRRTGAGTGLANLQMRFNNDSTNSYTFHQLSGTGGSVLAQGYATGGTGGDLYIAASLVEGGETASLFGVAIIDIHDYSSTTKNKTLRAFSGADLNGSGRVNLSSALYIKTNAITEINLITGTAWATSSTFALYGIKG